MIFDIDTGRYIEFVDFINKNICEFSDYCDSKMKSGSPIFLFGFTGTGKSPLIESIRGANRFSGIEIYESYSFYGNSKITARDIKEINKMQGKKYKGIMVIISIVNQELVAPIKEAGFDMYMLHGIK